MFPTNELILILFNDFSFSSNNESCKAYKICTVGLVINLNFKLFLIS